jgi:hypothetical protein
VAQKAHRLAHEVGVIVGEDLAHQGIGAQVVGVGQRDPPVQLIGMNRRSELAVVGLLSRAPLLHHYLGRDRHGADTACVLCARCANP